MVAARQRPVLQVIVERFVTPVRVLDRREARVAVLASLLVALAVDDRKEERFVLDAARLDADRTVILPRREARLYIWGALAELLVDGTSLPNRVHPHVLVERSQLLLLFRAVVAREHIPWAISVVSRQVLQSAVVRVILHWLLLHRVDGDFAERAH